MLNLEDIEVTFKKNTKLEHRILNKLNLHAKEAEFIIVIGENGAGKSTMLNVISGYTKVDSGKIFVSNSDITTASQIDRAKFISKVVQDPKVGTVENMTILENMAFALKRGQKRKLQLFTNQCHIKMFKEKLNILNMGLENRLNDLVSELSGGQRQALSMIMAILQDTKILLLDEVTAALDPSSSETIIKLTEHIVREQKLTCVMITHNMIHAVKYGDRLLILNNGIFVKEYNTFDKSQITPTELIMEFEQYTNPA